MRPATELSTGNVRVHACVGDGNVWGEMKPDFGEVFWYSTLKYCVLESGKRQSGPEFHSATIGAIPSS